MLRSGLVELKDYQTRGARFMVTQKYSINADDMGLGKSYQALEVGAQIAAKKILILCPAFLKTNWKRECEKYYELPHVTVDSFEGEIIITNYERFIKSWHKIGKVDLVIIDECHALKNMQAQRTKAVFQYMLIYRPDYMTLVTGTPIQNRVYELYSLLRLIDYNPNPTSANVTAIYRTENAFKDTFCKQYSMFIRGQRITKYEGLKNVDKLLPLLKGKIIRREKDKVLSLQDAIHKDVLVSFKHDEKLQKAWENDLRFTGTDSADKALAALNKAPFTVDYVKNLMDEIDSCVIFTDHKASCEHIAQALKAPFISGDVPINKRQEIIDGFQNGKYPILVCTIGAASTGLTLTRTCNMVFNDYSWVPGNNAQARDRIRRMGQTRVCVYHNIYGTVTDEFIGKELKRKESTIKAVGL
jgi:SWI/SNF-related matrix-associated actin-dependent regulator 1 of chromatin subfamily A